MVFEDRLWWRACNPPAKLSYGNKAVPPVMKIRSVQAYWVHIPIPPERQHTSDFGHDPVVRRHACAHRDRMRHHRLGRGQGAGRRHGAEPGADRDDQRGVRAAAQGRGPARHHAVVGDPVQRQPRAITRCARGGSFRYWAGAASRSRRSAAVDCALWDILGKSLGVPVWRLLGGRRSVDDAGLCLGRLGRARQDRRRSFWAMSRRAGFGAVKMRVGIIDGDPRHSARRVPPPARRSAQIAA